MNKIFYGNLPEQFGHLYKPESEEKLPVVIVIHGGYWKDNHTLDSYATKSIVDYLLDFNVAVWNIEYRRMEESGENKRAPWPAIFEDVGNALDFLPTIAESFNLDLCKVSIIGHSAGGHLATWAGSRSSISKSSLLYRSEPLRINKVLSISGVLDLEMSHLLNQPQQVNRLLGSVDCIEKMESSNPARLNDVDTELTIMHGRADETVPIAIAESYISKTKSNADFIVLENSDHFSMLPHAGHWTETEWHLVKLQISKMINTYETFLE